MGPLPPAPLDPVAEIREIGPVGLDFGQVVVPFGVDPARARGGGQVARQRRMSEAERELVRRRVPLQGASAGAAARYVAPDGLTVDVAALVPAPGRAGREAQLTVPDLAVRAGFGPRGRARDGVAVGISGWAGEGGAEVAVGVDAAVRIGPWDLRAGADWQRTARPRDLLAEEVPFRRIWGDSVAVDVRRALVPGWSVHAESEAGVFVARRGLAVPPWVRSAVGISADPRGPVRWTVVEVAGIEELGIGASGFDVVRVSTRIDAARWR